MTDVAVNLLDYPDPIFQPQYLPATFANTSVQPNPTSFCGLDLTGEQSSSFEVTRPSASVFDINWSLLAMTFQQIPQFQIYQISSSSDQDLTNSPQSHNNNTSNSQQQQQQQQQQKNNEMTAATTDFTNQQFPDVDNNSAQQSNLLQASLETPPFVEPPISYPCYSSPNTSSSSNPVVLDHPPVTNNYSSRNLYIGNYQQHQYIEHHNYHSCPTSHPSRVGMTNPQLINYHQPTSCLNQRIIYQNSSPASTSSIGRHHQKRISGSIGSNISYPRPENVTSTSLPSSIASNLFTFNQSTNASTMLVPSIPSIPSIYDHSTTMFTKPAPQTTITISNSTGTSVPSSESTSPIKQSYSYSGPPKSYYSRLPLYDRPFKCDTCPQSFNRNHDLKRHKRIHLAVKPYPCAYCDKQFSRKDALKRHILVKGCNNNNNKRSTSPNNTTNKNVDDDSTNTNTNSLGQKYDSPIESESPIKSEPTSDNGVHHFI